MFLSSLLTGGRRTPPNPGKVEKVRSLFLHNTILELARS